MKVRNSVPSKCVNLWRRLDRTGRVAVAILATLAAMGLAAPILANNQPLLVIDHGGFYLPALRFVPATAFNPGMPPIRADFHAPALLRLLRSQDAIIVWPPDPHGPGSIVWTANQAPAPPSLRDPLGTDPFGRDVLAEVLYGLRMLIVFGGVLTGAAAALGIAVGAVQGYYGGNIDLLGQRLIEIWNGLPVLMLLILAASIAARTLATLFVAMLALTWTGLIPVVRAEFLRARRLHHVRAARALGLSDWTIIHRHILPNATAPLFAYLPFTFAGSIVLLSSLDFLGLGPHLAGASFGALAAEARDHLDAPWLAVTAISGLAALLIPSALLGISLRDALDPRHACNRSDGP